MERFGQVFYIFLQRLLPKLEVFCSLPSMFRSSARSLHALPRLHPFLLQRLKFLFAGPELCISMLRDVSFRRTPHAPCRGLLHRSFCISMASSDVVLILFPVEWSYQSNTIWAWRFGFHTSPANAPRPYGWQSVQVSPRTSLGIFSQVPAVLPWSYPL